MQFRIMQPSVPVKGQSVEAAISACEKGGLWKSALHLLSLMPQADVVLNVFSCNAAISACEKAGQWQSALHLLSLMPQAKVVPNAISYNAAISACERAVGGSQLCQLCIC
eukprot:TRINITY_DN13828_c1_g2_i5.p1 TRINITY_DN13828_c1_g2~~TRINITY_DN13828_c1_g2_i5.p1  ORF type:complete len:110 (-),score=11.91 TRINITY_DN13828_c1_g2_i5:361-690(-)